MYAALATKKEVTKEMLESVKDLPKEQRAQILLRTGDKEKAETYAKEASNSATNQVQPLANYVEGMASRQDQRGGESISSNCEW
ncbi:MAG: hypothetical protein IPK15_27305 [Verrucomicrobia bacterium]|nr:hypothetical protein [Verrucomicrobiota bacterium]